jgi:predicted CopG family antitoxin
MSTILLQKKHLTNKKEFIDIQNKFVNMVNKEEFNDFKRKEMGHVEVNVKDIIKNPIFRTLLLPFLRGNTIETTRNLGVNLGYIKLCKYWKTTPTEVPTEIIMELMPKTQEEIDILIKDISENKDGELYNKLEKYKGKIFRDYFNTI